MAFTVLFFLSLSLLITASPAAEIGNAFLDGFVKTVDQTSTGQKYLNESKAFDAAELADTTPHEGQYFNFIVVGGASAGAVVASRLSEIKNVTVLLIEAGGNEDLVMDIPLVAALLEQSNVNWNYTTKPSDNYCLGMKNKQCFWAKGKVMGGTSTMNLLVANRGHPTNYDNWATLSNSGWSFKEVLPYFKKLENMAIPKFRKHKELHGTYGPVNIEYARYHTNADTTFMKAVKKLGYRTDYDYNGKTQNGFTLAELNTKNGRRWSSNRAYLHPAKGRGNLFATKKSLVKKVLIDSRTKVAYGVQFIKNKKTITVYANKEIILSAGTIASPQLLMLSGVGPKNHLKKMDIPVIKDLPVGQNLKDHVTFGGLIFLINQTAHIPVTVALNLSSPYFSQYVDKYGAGPLSMSNFFDAYGFMNVDDPFETKGIPNLEISFTTVVLGSVVQSMRGYSDKTWRRTFEKVSGKNILRMFPTLLSPLSTGEILLKNNDIHTHPQIIPNYFSEKEDVRILIEGIKRIMEISKTEALKQYGIQLYKAPISGCDYEYGSDSYWECALRTLTNTMWNPTGTCRMGPEGNSTSVVNPQLQVIGVKGLRVADLSIAPTIPTAHTNIPAMMIGEKAADMIKKHWGYRT